MSIIELLEQIGVDNITFQILDTDFTNAEIKGKKATITFATNPKIVQEMALSNAPPTQYGLIVWVPRELLPDFTE